MPRIGKSTSVYRLFWPAGCRMEGDMQQTQMWERFAESKKKGSQSGEEEVRSRCKAGATQTALVSTRK